MGAYSRRNSTAPLFFVFLMVTMTWSSAIDNRLGAQQDTSTLSDVVVAHTGWSSSTTLDSTDSVGYPSSLAIDSNDSLHVTYFDYTNYNLKYMAYDGSSWSTPVSIDSRNNVGWESSLAIDSNDNLHVTYFDSYPNDNLEYMTYDGSSWSTPVTLDSTDDVGKHSSLAIDSNDHLHVTYFDDTNDNLEYMTFDNSSWSTPVTLDSRNYVGEESSLALAIDSNDHLHVTYFDDTNDNLEYMTFDGSSWSTSISLDSTDHVGFDSSLAIDSNDHLHVTYYDNTNDNLEYMTYDGSSWSTPVSLDSTDNVGFYSSLAIDSNDSLHVTYRDSTNGNLEYMTHDGSSWSTPATLDNSTDDVGFTPSLAIDSNNNLHVTYYDTTNDNLEYMTYSATAPPVISYSPNDFTLTNNTAMSPTAIPTNTGGTIPSGIIDSTVNLGYSATSTSLVLDSNGSKHISYIQYVNGDLKYATDKSGSWVNTTIDSTTGTLHQQSSIALDSNENIHISYYNSSSRSLNYATNQNGSWETSDLNSGFRAGKYSSIALDSNDNIHISYIHDGAVNYSLDYASNINGSWSFTMVVAQGTLTDTSLAIDSNDKVHISFGMQTGKLMYATNKNGSWVSEIADWDSYVGAYPSLVLDSNDNAHISHHGGIGSSGSGSGLGQRLKYSTNAGGSWVNFNLDSYVGTSTYTGRYTSIALDSNENLHISYMDGVTKDLKYATNKSGGWVYTTLDAKGNTGLSTSLALDSSDNIHISYSLTQSPNPISGCELKYITLDSSSNVLGYSVSPALPAGLSLDIGTGEISGTPTAITPLATYTITARNSGGTATTSINITVFDDLPLISYSPNDLNLTNNSAMIILSPTNNGGAIGAFSSVSGFLNSTLETTGAVGDHNSMTIDANGNFHIAYYHSTSTQNLKYGTDKSGSWVYTTLDSTGDVGMHTSIAIDSNSAVHISYYDETNSALKYATDKSGSWVYSTLDSTGDVGMDTSIAIDSNDAVHISYYDVTNEDLKYASDQSSSWVITTLESTGDVGKYTSIALDSNDDVHISYNDVTNRYLKYATDKGGPWVLTQIDSSWNVGRDTSIAIDSSDKIHISYLDHATFDLKYATDKSGSWVTSTIDSAGNVGWYTSTAIDSNDAVHISYYYDPMGGGNGEALKYATDKSGSWVALTLAFSPGEEIGRDNAIVIDSNDEVHILYHDWTNQNLMYVQSTTTVVSGFSITPSLSNGLDFNTTTGNISGTPVALYNRTMYTITATNNGGSSTVFVNITVNDIAPNITYSPNDLNLTNNSAMGILSPTNTGGAIVSWSILPALSHGLQFNTTNGHVTGTSTALLPLTVYTITATNLGGFASTTINITVNDELATLSYPFENLTLTRGVNMAPFISTTGGGAVLSWAISPELPTGLLFGDTNGSILGNSTDNMTRTLYTVWGNNSGGAAFTTFNLTVIEPLAIVNYSLENITLTRTLPMASLIPELDGGFVATWEIEPSLPSGLSLSNGVILGIPLVNSTKTIYTIWANNTGGAVSSTVNITIVEPVGGLVYEPQDLILNRSVPMYPVSPTLPNGSIATWEIAPMLPAGLSLENGTLSGTPSVNLSLTTFTVWANHSGGSSMATFTIVILEPAPVVSYTSVNMTLIRGEMMPTLDPILSGGMVESWSTNSSLPDGLVFENGSFSGTPLVNSTFTSYAVRAQNSGGIVLVTLNITIVEPVSLLSLNLTQFTITRDTTPMSVQVNNSGGLVEFWQISPSLPGGLTMNDGFVSGIATESHSEIMYTIWGNNSGGSSSVTFTLTIEAPGVVFVMPSPEPNRILAIIVAICGLLMVFLLFLTLSGAFVSKRPEDQKLVLLPGQGEEEITSTSESSESSIETNGANATNGANRDNTTSGVNALSDGDLSESNSETVGTSHIDLPIVVDTLESKSEVDGTSQIDLPIVVNTLESNTGKNLVELPLVAKSLEPNTGKNLVDLPIVVNTFESNTGKNLVELPLVAKSLEPNTGKNLVELPLVAKSLEPNTGKNLVELPLVAKSLEPNTGKSLVDLPTTVEDSK